MEKRIQVSNLKKQYGSNVVLKDVTFDVLDGEIFAILGTNGAGKTTTLECMEGIRRYNGGRITVNGKTGVQLQSSTLQENMKGIEALRLFAKWNNVSVDFEFARRLGLTSYLKKQYRELSTGQKRRLHLALAMTGNPDIIFLDEPTAGLDVEGRVSLHGEIRKLKEQGKTILMASHDMAEVETLCDKLAIIKEGEIAFLGTPNELTAKMITSYQIQLKLSSELSNEDLSTCVRLESFQGYQCYQSERIDESLLELLNLIKQHGITVYDLRIERASLEESFLTITKGEFV